MKQCAILFADVAGSTALYENLGDERAFALIEKCLASMSACTREAGGRVVKTIGDAVMAAFATADEAAGAATEMQLSALKLGADSKTKVGLRIGFCFGPVVEQGTDVFGDAVNLASRLCDLASKGEIITARETADRLSPIFLPMLPSCTRRSRERSRVELSKSGGRAASRKPRPLHAPWRLCRAARCCISSTGARKPR